MVIVVDQESIRTGAEKPALETAAKLVDALAPSDAVGLLAFHGVAIDLTRNHARVRDALQRIAGAEARSPWTHNVTMDEATELVRGDRVTRARVLDRECPFSGDSHCTAQVLTQAREMVLLAAQRIQTFLPALGNLAEKLKVIRGPKHLIVISGGLPYDHESIGFYRDFARKAAEAQVVVHAIHLDQGDFDASDTKVTTSPFGGRPLTLGLSTLASMTGGAFYSGVARAAGVFARVEADINSFYEVGIEADPGDGGDSGEHAHAVELKVSRPDAIRTMALRPSMPLMRSAVSTRASYRLASEKAAIRKRCMAS